MVLATYKKNWTKNILAMSNGQWLPITITIATKYRATRKSIKHKMKHKKVKHK